MSKKILNDFNTKEVAYGTINKMVDLVANTLGPGGLPVIIQRQGNNPDGTPMGPLITKDGVTVCESISFSDPDKNTIAQAVLQVAKNTVEVAGDGTSTALLLAQAIFSAGYQHVVRGNNGIQLYNELKNIKNGILKQLDKMKIELNESDIQRVAKIAANGDEQIAKIVSEAILSVGEDGHIAIEESMSRETVLTKIEGAVYKQGWRQWGPHGMLLVNNKAKNTCELQSPAILLYAGKLEDVHKFRKFVVRLMDGDPETGHLNNIIPLLIVAYDYSDEVKDFIVRSKTQIKMPVAAIKAPFDGSPNARTQMLEDMAVLLGGQVTARGIIDLDDVTDEHLGCADKIEISPDQTVIYNGQGSEEDIIARVNDLKTMLSQERLSKFDASNIRVRIGKLVDGIAVIHAGGDSELEMKERFDRIEDAVCAARVAIEEGIVEGGGLALYKISQNLKGKTLGVNIMREALEAPIKKIIENVGENSDVILSHMPKDSGYNAVKKEYCNMVETGIIDPVKVTKSALENAVSIAGLLLTTGGAVVMDNKLADGAPNPLAQLMGG